MYIFAHIIFHPQIAFPEVESKDLNKYVNPVYTRWYWLTLLPVVFQSPYFLMPSAADISST